MNEITKSKYEEHVDERSLKFFRKWDESWNSLAVGLVPTKTLSSHFVGRWPICAYCGRKALPIQEESRNGLSTEYYDRGHCCVCKDAMDELEVAELERALKKDFEKSLYDLRKARPKINIRVVEELARAGLEDSLKDLQRWGGPFEMDKLGIKVTKGGTHETD